MNRSSARSFKNCGRNLNCMQVSAYTSIEFFLTLMSVRSTGKSLKVASRFSQQLLEQMNVPMCLRNSCRIGSDKLLSRLKKLMPIK
jgi:hypothetical protein